MIEYITSLTTTHAALFIAILALVVSLRANYISNNANENAIKQQLKNNRMKNLEKRTEILSEIDKQNAIQGHLLSVTAEKIILFQKNPDLLNKHPQENERLKQNINGIQLLKSNYEERRTVSEQIGAEADLEQQEKALAEIRRLTIHLEEELIKEKDHLNDLKVSLN